MRKLLLLSAMMGFAVAAFGQSGQNQDVMDMRIKSIDRLDDALVPRAGTPSKTHSRVAPITRSSTVNKVAFGSSKNLYSVLAAVQNACVSNQSLGIAAYIHRTNISSAGGSGNINLTYTADGGVTVDSTLELFVGLGRYPAGAIYNPSGNTNPGNAIGIVAGPIPTPDSTGYQWGQNFLGSGRLDGTQITQTIFYNDSTPSMDIMRNYTEVLDNGTVYNIAPNVTVAPATAAQGYVILKSTWNSATNSYDHSFSQTPVWPDPTFALNWQGMAWNNDGSVGYIVLHGNTATNNGYMNAYVYKTTNGGTSWTPVAFNPSTVPGLLDSVTATGAGNKIPFYGFYPDYVVDNAGNLHMLAAVYSQFSEHPDSLSYIHSFANRPPVLMDIYMTSSGWRSAYVTTIQTDDVPTTDPASFGLGWDFRLQGSRSPDGTKVFMTWQDSDPSLVATNLYPDIYGFGWDVTNGFVTDVTNFTAGGTYDGDNYWLFTSPRALKSGGTYSLPSVTTVPGATDLVGCNHFLVTGIEFDESDFKDPNIGIEEISAFQISKVYPNPAVNTAYVDISLNTSSNVMIEIFNALGQRVMVKDAGTLFAGNNSIEVNISGINSGLYFFTIHAAGESYTVRLVIK
jgi:hypothetical protein